MLRYYQKYQSLYDLIFQQMEEFIKQSVTTAEQEFHQNTAECFLLFEKYKLKTNVVGLNLDKEMIMECYYQLEGRMIDRYQILFQQLQNGLNSLQKNFKIAQATHLRTLNNIIRNYRRRVGILGNQPLSTFKYNRFDRYERVLLQTLLYNDRDGQEEVEKLKQELTIALQQGKNDIKDNYKQNSNIREDFRYLFEVIDKTECYSYKYYENFERSMQNTISTMESYFDKLNGFLSVWENVGSLKAYQVKSFKELQMEEKKHVPSFAKRNDEFSEEQLEELIDSCPEHSPLREQYRQRLAQLRHSNKEKQRKMEMIGKMFNKRKNRPGILMNRKREANVLDWYFNLENQKASFSFNDEFKAFNVENLQGDYTPTQYEMQKPFKKEKIEQIKQHLIKYQSGSGLNYQWWYDKYGKQGNFDLILCGSQQIQKRVQFEVSRQTVLQTSDDRKKRQVFDKQKTYVRQSIARDSVHIGYMFTNQKEQMQWLQQKPFHTEYYPDLVADDVSSSSIQFSEKSSEEQLEELSDDQEYVVVKKKKEKKQQTEQKVKEQEHPKEEISNVPEENQFENKVEFDQGQDFSQASLQQKLIESYFKEYSRKVLRKQSEPNYKKSKFIYFTNLEQIQWLSIRNNFQCQKIFVYTSKAIIYLKRIFSAGGRQKIKCTVYSLLEDLDEEMLKQRITECFVDLAIVTCKFISIYCELQGQNQVYFTVGLMLILVKWGQMPEDYENQDYIREGKIVIEDYNCYFNPEMNATAKNLFSKRYRYTKTSELFAYNKLDQEEINSKFTEETTDKSAVPDKTFKNQHISEEKNSIIPEEKREVQEEKKEEMEQKNENAQEEHQKYERKSEENQGMQRSNSRQNLMKYEPEVLISANVQMKQKEASEEQEDYDCL